MVRYRSRRPPDTALRARLRELANERRRFGYRRLFILLRREGEPSGINRIHRLYREEGLSVRKRRARRKAVGTRAPILVEAKPNARWSTRLRPRPVRQRPALPHPEHRRRRHQGVPGRDPGHLDLGPARGARTDDDHRATRQAGHDRFRPRHRVHLQRHARLVRGQRHRTGTSSRRESRCRTASSRASTAACATSFSMRPCSSISTTPAPEIARMGRRLQRPAPAFVAGLSHAGGLCRQPHRNGRSAAQPRPAPPIARCSTAPHGVKPTEALIAAG